ncbi:MAG: ComEC/Rec2 family competence protein, partial [Rubricoccaceae bacterium]|nr:ComEC/Rec2 family competence protein [Rubricoccaceae bacterium]
FQLSFAAVGALIVLVPILRQRIPDVLYRYRLSKAATDLVLTSVVATLGTAPVMLYHFGQLPLAGLVLNVIAIPATATALFGGLGTGLLGYHVPFLADAFAAVCELGTSVMMFAGEQGAQSLDWTVIRMFVREPLVVLALVSGLLVLAFWIRPRVRWRFVALTILLISLGAWTSTIRNEHQPRLDVLFLDVGQGDATLVTLPNGKTMLIDAGLRNAYTDHGTRTILPHLRRFGIDRLDAVVLTHADADHFGGALSVMEHIDVGRLIHSGHQKDNALWQRTLAVADSLGVPQRTVMAGDVLDLDASVRVRVLHPTGIPQSWEDGNDASVVLRLEYNNTSFLFTGDVEASGESSLVSTYGSLLASTVVKVAHHGSSTSSTEPFVDEAADSTTEFAVVSVAKRNRYGLPNEEPLARWITAGVDVLETAQEGAVWLQSNGTRVERVNWR